MFQVIVFSPAFYAPGIKNILGKRSIFVESSGRKVGWNIKVSLRLSIRFRS